MADRHYRMKRDCNRKHLTDDDPITIESAHIIPQIYQVSAYYATTGAYALA